jgi:hypothetical protein
VFPFFQNLNNAVLLVLANKNDIKGAMTSAEISDFLGLTRIKAHPWHIQSCCALTGEGYETPSSSFLASTFSFLRLDLIFVFHVYRLYAGMDWVTQHVKPGS